MARRIVALVVLMLVGVWLFAPTSSSQPAAACEPTQPMPATASPSPLPNFTPPPVTAAPSPLPATPTFTPEQRLSQLIESSQGAVVGTIRRVNEEQVLIDVEAYTNISELTSILTITTYRERDGPCGPEWNTRAEQVVSRRFLGERAVFFLNSYSAGKGVVVVRRDTPILYVHDGELYALDSAKSFGSIDQLDSWLKPVTTAVELPATAQPPPAVQTSRWQPWMWIPAALAVAGLALLTLGLILKRHNKT